MTDLERKNQENIEKLLKGKDKPICRFITFLRKEKNAKGKMTTIFDFGLQIGSRVYLKDGSYKRLTASTTIRKVFSGIPKKVPQSLINLYNSHKH